MAQRPWIFMINTFEVNTRNSNRKMLTLVTDSHSKLGAGVADPDILLLFNLLDPIYDNYRQITIDYDVVAGNREGGTLAFENVLGQIPDQLRAWEGGVRAVHYEDTPEEKTIFPNKRAPFQTGTYEERVSAIGTLAQKLSTIAALATTYALVQSFYNMALGTRLAQQQDEGALAEMSDLREQQRVLVADTLYGILGSLMFKYRSAREHIDNYFDLKLLRAQGEGAASTSLEGTVVNGHTGEAMVNVQVSIVHSDGLIGATTDANGHYVFNDLELDEAADAVVRFQLEGFAAIEEAITLIPGEDHELDATMQPIATPPPPGPTPPTPPLP